jgi:hypothetical protein
MSTDVYEFLEHHGIKGMHWGIRKEKSSSNQTSENKNANRNKRIKQIAIGAGILAAIGGGIYAAHVLQTHGGVSVKDISGNNGKQLAEKILKEPTDVIHLARGKHESLTFHKKGNTEDYFKIFDKMGGNKDKYGQGIFEKANDGSKRILSTFTDPENRKDFAGRPIFHTVVIPSSMSSGIHSNEDVKDKIWPLIKDGYDAFFEKSLKPKY